MGQRFRIFARFFFVLAEILFLFFSVFFFLFCLFVPSCHHLVLAPMPKPFKGPPLLSSPADCFAIIFKSSFLIVRMLSGCQNVAKQSALFVFLSQDLPRNDSVFFFWSSSFLSISIEFVVSAVLDCPTHRPFQSITFTEPTILMRRMANIFRGNPFLFHALHFFFPTTIYENHNLMHFRDCIFFSLKSIRFFCRVDRNLG